MERWNGRVALVTGASSGIGAGICRELVRYGLIVVGCGRGVKRIEEIAEEKEVKLSPGKLHAVRCDLSQESDILAMFDLIRSKFGRIDVCINNAGYSGEGPLLSGETSTWRNMIDVNVMALCICTRESYKLMKEKGIDDGQIINISSVGGLRLPGPPFLAFNFYCGTKFMVRALTQGLRKEVAEANTKIRVADISPGLVETELLARGYNDADKAAGIFSVAKYIYPKDIADAVIYILKSPPHVDVNDVVVQPTGQSF